MNRFYYFLACVVAISIVTGAGAQTVECRLTNPTDRSLFQKITVPLSISQNCDNKQSAIVVNTQKQYQLIDGFGFALTGGSAQHLLRMSAQARHNLLKELFSLDGNGIGINYLRISIGASDLNEKVYSYDDLPNGEVDMSLVKFDLAEDKQTVIPILKEILAISPKIKILGSPWSAPKWMKTNNDTRGGSLKPEFYDVYSRYLMRYIEEMGKLGIRMDAITIQNEPLHPGNNPSMYMPAEEQCEFVRNFLGPLFQRKHIDTKIIVYDHNANRPDYPISILNDTIARKYIDGSAFHLYEGTIDALSKVHVAHPDKNLYFTEFWVGAHGNFADDFAFHVNQLIIGAIRNWSRNVIEWNLTSNSTLTPHTDRGGCDECLGGLTIDGDNVVRNAGYYIIAHASKYVPSGSVRIESTENEKLNNVAFLTPEGKKVLVVINNGNQSADFQVICGSECFRGSLASGAVATYAWK
jgi:O-Glycosyl hydrolase